MRMSGGKCIRLKETARMEPCRTTYKNKWEGAVGNVGKKTEKE